MFVPESFRRQPKWLVLIVALGLVGLIGCFDYAAGLEWSFLAPYPLPIILVVWKTGRRLGFACAALCAATFWVAHIGSHAYEARWEFVLAVVARLFYFAVFVLATAVVKAHRQLDRARIEALERTEELERQILRASEREQQRIGRDLHDSLGPHLAAIRYSATFLANDLRQSNPPAALKAEQIGQMAADAVSLAQNLARGISLVPMDGAGLAVALEELASATSRLTGMAVSFCDRRNTHGDDPADGIHFYRITQEALNNAAKHGGARKVTIVLNKSEDSLRLAIADDGKGISSSPNDTRGMGLDSMRFRAQVLGGELRIDSNPNEGTIVSCEIPNHASRLAASAS